MGGEEEFFTEEDFLRSVPRLPGSTQDLTDEIDSRSGFILSWVDGKRSVSEILTISGMGRREAIQRIRDLSQRELMDFGDNSIQVKAFLRKYGQVLSEVEKEEIRLAWSRMKRSDHLSRLGLRPGAGEGEIRQAYWALSRKFHLDRYSGVDLGEYRETLEEINRKISEAYQSLRRSQNRLPEGEGKTVRVSSSPGETKEKENAAAIVFQEAKQALQTGNVTAAMAKAQLAAGLQPRNEEYRELYIRIRTLSGASE
jgi:hypothetical protein